MFWTLGSRSCHCWSNEDVVIIDSVVCVARDGLLGLAGYPVTMLLTMLLSRVVYCWYILGSEGSSTKYRSVVLMLIITESASDGN